MSEQISHLGFTESIEEMNPIGISMLVGFFSLLCFLVWLGVYNELGTYILPAIVAIPWIIII